MPPKKHEAVGINSRASLEGAKTNLHSSASFSIGLNVAEVDALRENIFSSDAQSPAISQTAVAQSKPTKTSDDSFSMSQCPSQADHSPSSASSLSGSGGRPGSLKHRILKRPGSGLNGDESMSASSSAGSTPVPSPASPYRLGDNANMPRTSVALSPPLPAKKRARMTAGGQEKLDQSESSLMSATNNTSTRTTVEKKNNGASNNQGTIFSESSHIASVSNTETGTNSISSGQFGLHNSSALHKFSRGSLIRLANGKLKSVESMSLDDFVDSAAISPQMQVDYSTLLSIEPAQDTNGNGIVLHFRLSTRNTQVAVEATVDHPFFVQNKGWASAAPRSTMVRYGLTVAQLLQGDVCVSLSCRQSMPPPQYSAAPVRVIDDSKGSAGDTNSMSTPILTKTDSSPMQLPDRINNRNGDKVKILNVPEDLSAASLRRWSAPEDDRLLKAIATLPPS